jgi:hypothetical protein
MSERTDKTRHAFALLQATNPVDLDRLRDELDEARLDAARTAALKAQPLPDNGLLDQRWSRGRRSRRLAWAAVLVALTGSAWGLLSNLPGGNEPARAERVLSAAASLAAKQPATSPGPGQYMYLKERNGLIGGPSETVEWWVSSDGSGRMHRTGGKAIGAVTSANGRVYGLRGWGSARDKRTHDLTFGRGGFANVYDEVNPGILHGRLDDLPTNPERLEVVLRQKLRSAIDYNADPAAQSVQMLQVIEEALANPLASPALRSAAYQVAAGLDGATINEHATDPAGTAATRISFCLPAIPMRYEVFFDPSTSATLGTQESDTTACRSSAPPGLTSYSVYQQKAIVDSIKKRP